MGQKNIKKKRLADSSAKKRLDRGKKKINPFEVHINKEKHNVLGRTSKADRGLPGVSRSKALEKRKNTLLQEYNLKDRDNVFKDNRIGEKNVTMSLEEKAQARYAAEMIKAHKKRNIYNLDDSEVLTHRGQTLEEIEKFEDPRSDDDDYDDEDNNNGQLGKKFVSAAHFGGGIFSETNGHKDVLAELILQSKKQKYEKQKTREDTIKKTEQLDSEWKDLQSIVIGMSKSFSNEEEKIKPDDYDMAVNQLRFESRGKASDPLKSEEEIQRKENERLEKYERERLERMNGFLDDSKHKSADNLDDGFDIEDIEEENEEEMLVYDKDGVMVGAKKTKEDDEDKVDDDDENSESNDEDDDEDEEENDEIDEDSNAEESEEEEDNFSDLKESDSSSDEEEEEEKKPVETKSPAKIVTEKLVKVDEPAPKLTKSFEFYMQDIMNISSQLKSKDDAAKLFKLLNTICPQLWDLIQKNQNSAGITIQTILKEKHDKFENNIKKYPEWDTLILFKIVSLLFPTSDFRHSVVTPCLVFMSQILFQCRVKSKLDISKGLFVTTLILEYTAFSTRFSPGAINFLRGLIYLSTVKTQSATRYVIPPFKRDGDFSNSLVLSESKASLKIQPTGAHMKIDDFISGSIDNEFKIRVFLSAVNILQAFKKQWEHLDAVYSIFEPIINLMKMNSYEKYPKNIQKHVKNVIKEFSTLKEKKLEYLARDAKKVKALKLYEPKFEVV